MHQQARADIAQTKDLHDNISYNYLETEFKLSAFNLEIKLDDVDDKCNVAETRLT